MPDPGILVARSNASSNRRPEGLSEPSAPVPWWSFTKTLLAGAALALVKQGRLNLDATIEGKLYSLRHLLQHTSGLSDYGGLTEYHAAVASSHDPWPPDDLLRRVKSDQLLFTPGTSWSYSNVGYLFVRQIIERVMDSDLNAALRALLFDPLGAEGVFIATSAEHLENTAWGNERHYHPGWVYHGLAVGPPSTAAWILDRLLYSEFLSSHLKMQMLNPVLVGRTYPTRPFIAPSYGLGLMIDLESLFGRMVGHTGQGPGSTAAVYSFPDVTPPCTLAAFMPHDGPDAAGTLETHIQTLVR